MRWQKTSNLLTIAALAALASCSGGQGGGGGSASSGGASFGQNMTAQFIDAPVKGLKFETASGVNSTTGDLGKFQCKRGERVSFSLGGLDLGTAACGGKIFIADLFSSKANYKWQQAAAVIQSFATNSGGSLDLTNVDPSLDLSSLAYNSTDLTFEADLGAMPGVNLVDVATATSHAEQAITENIELPSQLEFVLDQMAGQNIKVRGKLKPESQVLIEGERFCWENIEATVNFDDSEGYYKLNVSSAWSWDNDSELENPGICSTAESSGGVECKNHLASELPKPKIVTGNKIDMNYSFEDSLDEYGGDIEQTNTISLDAIIGKGNVKLNGTLESRTKAIGTNENAPMDIKCQYTLTSEVEVETSPQNGPKPESGEFKNTGAMCNDLLPAGGVILTVNNLAANLNIPIPDAEIDEDFNFQLSGESGKEQYYEVRAGEEDQLGYLYMIVESKNEVFVEFSYSIDDELMYCAGTLTLE